MKLSAPRRRIIKRYVLWLVLGFAITLGVVASQSSYVQALISRENGPGAAHTSGHPVRQPAAVTSGLVAWYPLDGDVKDYSGNGYDGGTLTNFTGTSDGYVSGKFGKGLMFNSATSDYVPTTTQSPFNFTDQSFTISAWIKDAAGGIIFAADGAHGGWGIFAGNGASGTGVTLKQTGGCTVMTGGATLSNLYNTGWHFLLAVVTTSTTVSANNTANIYEDNVLVGTETGSTCLYGGPTVAASLGARDHGGSQYFSGVSDDIRVYNRALSSAEMTTLYQASSPIACDQTCAAWWKLDETGGNTVHDATGNTGNQFNDNGNTASGTGVLSKDAVFVAASTQKLTTSVAASADLSPGTGDFSYSLWMKPTSHTVNSDVLYNGASGSTTAGLDLRYLTSGVLEPLFSDGTNRAFFTSVATLSNGTWYHVVVTGSRAGNMTLYINGSSDSSVSITTESLSSVSITNFVLGFGGGTSNYYDGALDEVAVWHRVLSSTEVTDLYNSGSGKTLSGLTDAEKQSLVSYWNLDENSSGSGAIQRNDSYAGIGSLSSTSPTMFPKEGIQTSKPIIIYLREKHVVT